MELQYCDHCGKLIPVANRKERIKPGKRFVCAECVAIDRSLSERETPQSRPGPSLEAPDLFSPGTVAIHKREVQEALERNRKTSVSSPTSGSSAPAGTARRLQFRCLHCRATLQVRPVKDLSRTICPKCKGEMLIDPTGVVSKGDGSAERRSAGTGRKGFRAMAHVEPRRAQSPIVAPKPAPSPAADEAPATEAGSPGGRGKKKTRAAAEGGMVRVSAFLTPEMVEKIQESGKPVSQFIRETVAEKVDA